MAISNQTPPNVATEFATLAFVIQQLTSGYATATLVRVQACTNSGGVVGVGTVDVQLLVDQITEDGQTIPHGTVFRAPYMRVQGGANAIILDPQPGDIGICVFASRDISPIKSDPNAARNRRPVAGAPPGSRRIFSYADALYVGGVLNGVPTQYVQFNEDGITVVSPTEIKLQAPTITLDGHVEATGTIHSDVDVISDNISGKTHTHNDPQGGVVGPPNP